MRRAKIASALFMLGACLLGAIVPASAEFGRPLARPSGPSFSPGVPSYNPGVPGQVPGRVFGPGHVRHGRFGPRYAYPQVVYPYGFSYSYGYDVPPIVFAPRSAIPPQLRRSSMDNPFYEDLGDPFY